MRSFIIAGLVTLLSAPAFAAPSCTRQVAALAELYRTIENRYPISDSQIEALLKSPKPIAIFDRATHLPAEIIPLDQAWREFIADPTLDWPTAQAELKKIIGQKENADRVRKRASSESAAALDPKIFPSKEKLFKNSVTPQILALPTMNIAVGIGLDNHLATYRLGAGGEMVTVGEIVSPVSSSANHQISNVVKFSGRFFFVRYRPGHKLCILDLIEILPDGNLQPRGRHEVGALRKGIRIERPILFARSGDLVALVDGWDAGADHRHFEFLKVKTDAIYSDPFDFLHILSHPKTFPNLASFLLKDDHLYGLTAEGGTDPQVNVVHLNPKNSLEIFAKIPPTDAKNLKEGAGYSATPQLVELNGRIWGFHSVHDEAKPSSSLRFYEIFPSAPEGNRIHLLENLPFSSNSRTPNPFSIHRSAHGFYGVAQTASLSDPQTNTSSDMLQVFHFDPESDSQMFEAIKISYQGQRRVPPIPLQQPLLLPSGHRLGLHMSASISHPSAFVFTWNPSGIVASIAMPFKASNAQFYREGHDLYALFLDSSGYNRAATARILRNAFSD